MKDAVYVVFSRYTECVLVTALPLVALCFLNYKIAVKIKKSNNFKQRYVDFALPRSHVRT